MNKSMMFVAGSALMALTASVLPGCAAAGLRGTEGAMSGAANAPIAADEGSAPASPGDDEGGGHGTLHTVLLYLPDRLFDLLDIVRARVRVGPGVAVGARATEYADAFAGSYASLFVGIPGPRGKPKINWPFGLESNTGVEVSVADATTGMGAAPDYGDFEFGLSLHALLLGVDVGVDPWEALDFLAGILTFDPVHDDL